MSIPWIGVDYGQQGAADIKAFSRWADDNKCQLGWRPSCGLTIIDCSNSDATAPPAPDGLYGEITRQLAANATHVRNGPNKRRSASDGAPCVCVCVCMSMQLRLKLGGTALHESWRHKLIFNKAKHLIVNIKAGASASGVADSIPRWLSEGQGATSRHFPAVEKLTVQSFSLSLADVRATSSKLRPFLGGMMTLKSVDLSDVSSFAAAHEFLCCLSVGELDEVEVAERDGCVVSEWSADAPDTLSRVGCRSLILRHTNTEYLRLRSKAGVADFIKLALALRPVSVQLEWGSTTRLKN